MSSSLLAGLLARWNTEFNSLCFFLAQFQVLAKEALAKNPQISFKGVLNGFQRFHWKPKSAVVCIDVLPAAGGWKVC